MANTYYQVYLQFVFAVKYRNAILQKSWRPHIFGVIGNLITDAGCKNIIVNGVEDHVHCFVGLKPAKSMSDLMKEVKAKSSKHINDHLLTPERFEWRPGFGAFSYSHSAIKDVYQYILHQEAHHAKRSFRDEYIELLQKFEIDYDEQYLFDELI